MTCTLVWECNAGYGALYGEEGQLIQADYGDNGITVMTLAECSEIDVMRADENHKDLWTNCMHDFEYGWECDFEWPETFSEEWLAKDEEP